MTLEELEVLAQKVRLEQQAAAHTLRVCVASSCHSSGSDGVLDRLHTEVKARGMDHFCAVKGVGCRGLCSLGPLVAVEAGPRLDGPPVETLYQNVQPADVPEILDHLGREPLARLRCDTDLPFFTRQKRIVLENAGLIEPERIEDYAAQGGYRALHRALGLSPEQVVQEITLSGLRGRGGAGYPTGLKWATVARAAGARKYVICNADEGDPGAYMDRSVLESDPYRILEGMAIAGYAIGAEQGYVYVRAEYPLAVQRLKTAILRAGRAGFLGDGIAGTPFRFNVEIRLGAGAFVCGEETALIASIEGGRGTPRPRPPYPAEQGLWGMPTLINNVETFANVAPILRRGADWFAGIGTEGSKGTKVFALVGRVKHTGLIEVPMGTPLRDIVEEIGGGVSSEGATLKAVQTGGPSGGCIPERFMDTPVDFESLVQLGSFMGSGGMIVIDSTSCAVDLAKYFMEFCMSESCGKCVPCRVGTVQLHTLLDRITRHEATMDDLAQLEELCLVVRDTSLCGLGQGAPNPVLSTLRYFRDEYLAHIQAGACPAGVCEPATHPGTLPTRGDTAAARLEVRA